MARFVPIPGAIQKLMRGPEATAHMALVARGIAAEVRAAAPRHTGDYERSIQTDGDVVYSDDPFAHLIEWGSANNPPYAPLRRGTLAAGLRLDESR